MYNENQDCLEELLKNLTKVYKNRSFQEKVEESCKKIKLV